jgi:cholesterol oxidase
MRATPLPRVPGETARLAPAATARGLTFRETMTGWFALGEDDPAAGARRGREQRTVLRMRAEAGIADVDSFVADAGHRGALTGEVEFAPLGDAPVGGAGAIQLFVADEQRRAPRLMVYELALDTSERPLYFAGEKLVMGSRVSRLWRETTTLHARLHEGRDRSAPIIGAGILMLSPIDLARLVPTIRGTAPVRAQRTRAVWRFGRFFAGELWDSYVAAPRESPGAPS